MSEFLFQIVTDVFDKDFSKVIELFLKYLANKYRSVSQKART